MNLTAFYSAFAFLPLGFLAVILTIWRSFEDAKGRPPIADSEKLLRPPGHSAFQKVEKLNDDIDNVLFWFICMPAILVIAYLVFKLKPAPIVPHFWEIVAAGSVVAFVYLTWRFIAIIKERNNWRLGYRGERAVGEYLNQLMLHGCHVFHDFPLNGDSNLDHIVVAPSGIYAIETKIRTKRARLKNNYKVICNGKTLQFPDDTDTKYLAQAHYQASRLARILTDNLKTVVDVEPILTLPGWYVERRGLGDVRVLNHKEIASAILTDTPPVFSPDQIENISAWLERKCRDVAF